MFPNLIRTAAISAFVVAAAPAFADNIELGLLDCRVEGGVGFVFGSTKDVTCEFIPSDDAMPRETYSGAINKYGLDVGVTGTTVMKWLVLAATDDASYEKGTLAGTYIGPSAEASAAAGAGAKLLVGGSGDTFSLQPLSLQAQEGVNVAVGIAELELHQADL